MKQDIFSMTFLVHLLNLLWHSSWRGWKTRLIFTRSARFGYRAALYSVTSAYYSINTREHVQLWSTLAARSLNRFIK